MQNLKFLQLFNILSILCVVSILGACASKTYIAPVREVAAPPTRKIQHHVVAKGETLYSIAWRYNLNHKYIAEINGLGNGSQIWPGQKLALNRAVAKISKQATKKVAKAKKQNKTTKAVTSRTKKAPKPKPKFVKKTVASSKKQTQKRHTSSTVKKSNLGLKWSWPLKGKILSGFHGNGGLNKGIDVKAKLGQPVVAAEAGHVVYSGTGLRGYGQLLILKHSDQFLSAYAHNRKLLVKEGAKVKSGQKIAEAGATGTNEVKLHFEIRYNGKPVDPLKYLPR